MSRPWENDVKSSSQKSDFDVQINDSLSLSVYRGCVMIENDYTMMRKSMKRMEVKMEWISLCISLWPHLRIPSASNVQTYYMLHTVWGAEVQKRLGACVLLVIQELPVEWVVTVTESWTGPCWRELEGPSSREGHLTFAGRMRRSSLMTVCGGLKGYRFSNEKR